MYIPKYLAVDRLHIHLTHYKNATCKASKNIAMRNAFDYVSIITDNAFTQEQFTHMLVNHLDEIIRMTA